MLPLATVRRWEAMRYYGLLALGACALACVLGSLQLIRWWGNEDITILLKTLNQQIAPAAIFCPDAYYPVNSTVTCELEGPEGRGSVSLHVLASAIEVRGGDSTIERIEAVRGFPLRSELSASSG